MAEAAQIYNDRYEIVRQIARGGMADVFLARDQLLDRPVALKVLFPELSTDRSFVERFRREAQAAANLSHPNIVSVYDFGEEAGTSFIVMEYIDGQTLTEVIRGSGRVQAERAATIGADVAAALAFAHRNGVVHRDVKPGNVLIDASGHVKVTDFGIARATGTQENLTQTGAVMGTATYFSPEQAQGSGVDARSDVYSLGVVLYEMVTGRPPFTGDSAVSIAYKHVQEVPPAPRTIDPAIPDGFERIVSQAMAKDPAVRYQTAEELRADLLRFVQGRTVMAVVPTGAPTTVVAATTVQPAVESTRVVRTTETAPLPDQRRTGAYLVLLFVMLAALLGLLFLLGKQLGFFGNGSSTASQVEVPSVVGQPVDAATTQLTGLGLLVAKQTEANDTVTTGTVFAQDPVAGAKLAKGATITLKVSTGAAPGKVPAVVGLDQNDAADALTTSGFTVKKTSQADASQASGKVLAQSPAGGTTAPKGSTVNIVISTGKPQVKVPDVRNMDANEAFAALRNAQLNPRQVNEQSATVDQGRVTRTDPAGGTSVDQGSTVNVYVSTGPPPTTTTTGSTTTSILATTTTTVKRTTTTSSLP